MSRLQRLFKEPAFHLLLVVVYALQFGWPFLTIPEGSHAQGAYLGLFGSWMSFIALLFVISRVDY